MNLIYTKHEEVSLRKHSLFNEKWLHDRIADDTSIIGLGDVRVIDRERAIEGGGRLDMLLLDEDNSRRYEIEIQLGATDPSHIIRCIEYWDVERRRYPGYEHVAVLVAENITTRFLNVMALLAGSIPMIAIQLDAISVGGSLLLHFTQVLDQTELRLDDTETDGGGGQTDRRDWENKVGAPLLKLCDEVLAMINQHAANPRDLNYLRGYIGLQSQGVVNNFIFMSPKAQKKYTHIAFRNENALEWKERFEEAGVPVTSKKKGRVRISVTPSEFAEHKGLINSLVEECVKEFER